MNSIDWSHRSRRVATLISAAVGVGSLAFGLAPSGAAAAVELSEPTLMPFVGSFPVSATWAVGGYHDAGAKAIDVAMAVGTPIYAAGAGVVVTREGRTDNCNPDKYSSNITVGVNACLARGHGAGQQVSIRHSNGITSSYFHLSAYAPGLAVGQPVEAGQLIGLSGNSGISTGPHLHYQETNAAGTKLDPGTWVGCVNGAPRTLTNLQSLVGGTVTNEGYDCVLPQTGDGPVTGHDGYLFVSAIGADGNLYYRARNERTDRWTSQWATRGQPSGVSLRGTPSVVGHDGYLFMTTIGTDGNLYYSVRRDTTDAWTTGWTNRGRPNGVRFRGSPAVVAHDGYLFMGAIGTDGNVYYKVRNADTGAWSVNWTRRGRPSGVTLVGAPSFVATAGQLFVIATGSDGSVYEIRRNATTGKWSPWGSRGKPSGALLRGSPTVVAHDGYLFLSAVGTDGRLHYRARNSANGKWTTWVDRGRPSGVSFRGSPALLGHDGNLFVSAIGNDGNMYYVVRNDDTGAWSKGWTNRGRPSGVVLYSDPNLASHDGLLFMSAIGSDGRLHYRFRNEDTGAWSKGWVNRERPQVSRLLAWR